MNETQNVAKENQQKTLAGQKKPLASHIKDAMIRR